MKLFGLEIRKAAPVDKVPSSPQVRPDNPQGPMTPWFKDYVMRKVSGDFYEMLREGIPIIDSAIRRLISLNGTIKIIGDKADCVQELEDFILNVPVNDTQKGIHAFLENASNETFEQGFCLSEFIATADMRDIAGLRVADSKDIIYRRNKDGKAEPWYRFPGNQPVQFFTLPANLVERILTAAYGQVVAINGMNEVKLDPSNKIYFSINNENTDPYGVPMMRSMEFCSQILVTLQNSIMNVAERFGDPMYHLHYKAGKGNPPDLEARRLQLQTDFSTIVTAKRAGKSGDMVTAGGADSEVNIKVIGHEGQILAYDIPLRHVLEQIVSKTNLPAWMLGIYWSTTERMATLEVESALQDAKIRQLAMMPQFINLFSVYLRLRGKKFSSITTSPDKPGDWGFYFETPNLRDVMAMANARFLNAQADLMESGAGAFPSASATSVQVGQATFELASVKSEKLKVKSEKCSCGATHSSLLTTYSKELSRPTLWPELDKVEMDYENELKYDWEEFRKKVFTLLGLNDVKTPSSLPLGKGEMVGVISKSSFSFTAAQRQQIMDDLARYNAAYDITDPDSPVRWYYGQSYSLGLIQAAKLIGKERPILDILKNSEIYEELVRTGFDLLKNNATRAIVEDIIPEMERQMLAGSNPRLVGERLERLFGDQNSDWERLARSEMSMAAERAKLDEWGAWDVKRVEFTPAPDACPICFSLAGDYDIGNSPVPVADTHPRCRCSIRPAMSET